jgi:hypothetical protein
MNSFAVIRYFNYRKEVSFTILKTFDSIKNADKYAFKSARDDFGEEVIEGVSERWVYVDSVLSHGGYTKGDGYDQYVYTVIEIPEPEYSYDSESESDYNSDEESDEELEIEVQDNGKYEWGFDLTDFNDYEKAEDDETNGAEKFQELLDMFNLKLKIKNESKHYISIESAYTWTNYDDDWSEDKNALMLVTANNPITGEYMNNKVKDKEVGYLSYVGVTCNSRETLKHFIEEFRAKASYIKGESNFREYI